MNREELRLKYYDIENKPVFDNSYVHEYVFSKNYVNWLEDLVLKSVEIFDTSNKTILIIPTHKEAEECDAYDQLEKLRSEMNELETEMFFVREELEGVGDVDRKEEFVSEYFDVVQAGLGELKKLGVDIQEANEKHIEKLRERGVLVE